VRKRTAMAKLSSSSSSSSPLLLLLLLPTLLLADDRVQLTSDGPAVLDAPITFTGKLIEPAGPDTQYRWRWFDTASPGHYKETEANGTVTTLNYTIVYPSEAYDSHNYEMSLTIYEFDFFYWREIGKEKIRFSITKELNGHLTVMQNYGRTETRLGESIISSVKETEIDVVFHDPKGFLKDAVIHYFWFINTVNYGQTPTGHFEYNFTNPGDYDVEVTAIAYFNAEPNSTLEQSSLNTVSRDMGSELSLREGKHERPSKGVKMAIFQKRIVSKEPIHNVTVVGDVMLKHGKLVDLDLNCTGTGPWLYCWHIMEKGYNITGNETCDDPQIMKRTCEFPILWYFRTSDTYNFLIIIKNDVSTNISVVPVTIYDAATEAQYGLVLIPIASSIVVVVLIISGVALHAHYRNRLAVEVADFDFGQADEEELQYKSFWERLRESFSNHFTSGGSDLVSEGSSVSGRRSVQLPGPAGIGYGSIT